jgi:eukaryotic-like serine/threonine-protein kinase
VSVDGPPPGLPTHLRVQRRLGSGGSGEVWLVRDTRRGRNVALKVLSAPTGQAAERLEQEARALARASAVPGVVSVLECGLTPSGVAWFISELAEGDPLSELLASGPLDRQGTLRVGVQLAAALAGLHRLGISHGDVTPANVVVAPDGDALLVDLGLASLDAGRSGPTGCTPAYAAPDRLRGAQPAPASDVWSLAILLAEALTGEPPSASAVSALAPDPLGRLLARCVDPVASRRPAASEVHAVLRDAAGATRSARSGRAWLRRAWLRRGGWRRSRR